jgi:hypothetical protein
MFVKGKDKSEGKALPVQAMKAYVGSRDIACLIHKLSTSWGSISHPGHFTVREGTPGNIEREAG